MADHCADASFCKKSFGAVRSYPFGANLCAKASRITGTYPVFYRSKTNLLTQKVHQDYQHLILPEFRYSRTAYIYFLMQMQEYESAMKGYRCYIGFLQELGEYIRHCLECIYTGKQHASDILNDYEASHQIPWKREALLQLYQYNNITDLRVNIKRSKTFFLERQLAWLGKTYDKHCWVTAPDIEECATSLMDHLISWSKEGYFLPTEEFIKTCYDFFLKGLEALKNDIHKKNYLPKLNKLNKCFQELGLPYRIGAKQLTHDGKRKTHWKVEKTSPAE